MTCCAWKSGSGIFCKAQARRKLLLKTLSPTLDSLPLAPESMRRCFPASSPARNICLRCLLPSHEQADAFKKQDVIQDPDALTSHSKAANPRWLAGGISKSFARKQLQMLTNGFDLLPSRMPWKSRMVSHRGFCTGTLTDGCPLSRARLDYKTSHVFKSKSIYVKYFTRIYSSLIQFKGNPLQ